MRVTYSDTRRYLLVWVDSNARRDSQILIFTHIDLYINIWSIWRLVQRTEYREQSTEYRWVLALTSLLFSKLSKLPNLSNLPTRQTPLEARPEHYNPSTLFDLVTKSHCHRGWGMWQVWHDVTKQGVTSLRGAASKYPSSLENWLFFPIFVRLCARRRTYDTIWEWRTSSETTKHNNITHNKLCR